MTLCIMCVCFSGLRNFSYIWMTWEESVRSRPGFENERAAQNRMLLSAPTRLGLRITGKGMLYLMPKLIPFCYANCI